jgi:hypothetical protein
VFRRKLLLLSSGSEVRHLLAHWLLAGLIFDPEDGNNTFLRNVDSYMDYPALIPEDGNFQIGFLYLIYSLNLICPTGRVYTTLPSNASDCLDFVHCFPL